MPGGMPVAVLTGDLVRSTRLEHDALNRARRELERACRDAADWAPGLIAAGADFFRGDSWQILVQDARYFLRVAVYLRARLRAANRDWDTRIAIGIGKAEFVDDTRTSLSTGSAFIVSGRALDAMVTSVGFAVGMAPGSDADLGWLDPLAQLCSAAMDHWTERQSDIACRSLPLGAPLQRIVAQELGITQQAVSKSLGSAGFGAILSAIAWVEQVDWARYDIA